MNYLGAELLVDAAYSGGVLVTNSRQPILTSESEHCEHRSMSLTGFWYISAIMIMVIAFRFVMKMMRQTVLAFIMHIS
jgi:hypothetical protein